MNKLIGCALILAILALCIESRPNQNRKELFGEGPGGFRSGFPFGDGTFETGVTENTLIKNLGGFRTGADCHGHGRRGGPGRGSTTEATTTTTTTAATTTTEAAAEA